MKSLADVVRPIQNLNITRNILTEYGTFPNNGLLPLLLYHKAFPERGRLDTDIVREILETNSWTNSWVDSIYDYHHYHGTTHEVLVILHGSARVQFGGPNGITLPVEKGDVIVIPAGVAHKKIDEADGFSCLGAYPQGKDYDMAFGKREELPEAFDNIRNVPLPENDPLYGYDGPLVKNWFPDTDQSSSAR